MAFANPNHLIARRIEHRSISLTHLRRAPGAHIDDPNFLLRAGGIGCWVRIFSCRILPLAAHVCDSISTWREDHIAQFLPVIAVVMRQLPTRPRRRFRNPNVALSFGIECPSDLVATL